MSKLSSIFKRKTKFKVGQNVWLQFSKKSDPRKCKITKVMEDRCEVDVTYYDYANKRDATFNGTFFNHHLKPRK